MARPFSAEGVRFWMIELASTEQGGWPSFEGFLLREFLSKNLSLDNCNIARQLFKQLNPSMPFLPKWKLLARYFARGDRYYAPYAPQKWVLPVEEVTPEDDADLDDDLPFFLQEMLAGR